MNDLRWSIPILCAAACCFGAPAAAVSLYDEASYRALTSDRRAQKPGDLLTVLVFESLERDPEQRHHHRASRAARASRWSRTYTRNRAAKLTLTEDFAGRGRIQRSGKLAAQTHGDGAQRRTERRPARLRRAAAARQRRAAGDRAVGPRAAERHRREQHHRLVAPRRCADLVCRRRHAEREVVARHHQPGADVAGGCCEALFPLRSSRRLARSSHLASRGAAAAGDARSGRAGAGSAPAGAVEGPRPHRRLARERARRLRHRHRPGRHGRQLAQQGDAPVGRATCCRSSASVWAASRCRAATSPR